MGEPLTTFKLYEEFKSMGDDPTSDRAETMMKEAVLKMPPVNRHTFLALLDFMGEVAANEKHNKVSP